MVIKSTDITCYVILFIVLREIIYADIIRYEQLQAWRNAFSGENSSSIKAKILFQLIKTDHCVCLTQVV